MNEYEVTYAKGDVVEIEAWTPEAALAIADEDAEENGCSGLSAVSAASLKAGQAV
jgi:hypothetical protein